MTTAPANDIPNDARQEPAAAVPAHAIVMLTAGMAAAWFAAGSTGLVAHPLQRALTWLALAVALIATRPRNARSFGTWAVLASGVIVGLLFTASAIPTLNVLAIAVVLAAIAQVSRGLPARVALIAALSTAALGCFRLASTTVLTVWHAAEGLGWLMGRAAGGLAGSRLEVGATFGGIDFLILTFAVYTGWIICTVPPRRSRALWMAATILLGHFVYLVLLAYSEKLLALLPPVVLPPASDISNVGIWTWTNGLRTLIPWNVPLAAMFIDIVIVAAMVRNSPWLFVVEIDPEELKRRKAREEKEEVPGSVLAKEMLFHFGPPMLAVAVTLLATLGGNHSDLTGKKIVAYDHGYLNWLKPEYDSPIDGRFGMLPLFVESLGGKFQHSKDLAEADLAKADVLLLIHPDQPWPQKTLDRVWDYVRGGGSLLLAAEPAIREKDSSSSFNDVLAPSAMEVRFDTAVPRVCNWEQSYDVMAHPAMMGIDDLRNQFGIQLGSSIRTSWPARPALVGRWGWSDPGNDAISTGGRSYAVGDRLGDLVLAAEQTVGRGRVFVLGDTLPLQNDGLPAAFPFAGRLLSYLANRPSSPQAAWRQWLILATLLAMLALMAARPAAWQTMLTPAVLGVSLLCCVTAGHSSSRVLPDWRSIKSGGNVAYIDASHLEAYQSDSQIERGVNHGIAEFERTLMRQGYLPLLAPDVTPERLERCRLFVSIAPSREFSSAELAAVKQFVHGGGTFLCMVGGEESRSIAPLLADFGFTVPHSPVLPAETAREFPPLGSFRQTFSESTNNRYVQFYAGWPIDADGSAVQPWIYWSDRNTELPIVVYHPDGSGGVFVIGDTHFAANENLQTPDGAVADNIAFWRWLLTRLPGQKPWDPPAATSAESSSGSKKDAGRTKK
ncbi:MAG: DUF4350 domain-containing protein [Thermoguttaceae bacterium]